MKKKGFTLIELLAVIVILAIIALIATPIIMNVINDAKKGAFKDSIYGIIEAIELDYTKHAFDQDILYEVKDGKVARTLPTATEINIKGNVEGNGIVLANSNGKLLVQIQNNSWCATKDISTSKISLQTGECEKINTKFENGTAVYFNPATGKKCNESESVSTTGTKTGCMKWYAFLDSDNSYTLNLILDHNTTAAVTWNSNRNQHGVMNEAKTALNNDVADWINGLNPRFITANEIAQITGNNNFDNKLWSSYYSLHDNSGGNPSTLAQGTNHYAWLIDYLSSCTNYGCNIQEGTSNGYWTSTPVAQSPEFAWAIDNQGQLAYKYLDDSAKGIRPVITVSKLVLQ